MSTNTHVILSAEGAKDLLAVGLAGSAAKDPLALGLAGSAAKGAKQVLRSRCALAQDDKLALD